MGARLNGALPLAQALNSDWRLGAEVFQALLLDHDLALNWGNWAYMAGVGADPRDRLFKTVTQGERYDPHAALIADWVPELAKLPIEARHRPWEAKNEGEVGVPGYPEPIVDPVGQVGKGKRA